MAYVEGENEVDLFLTLLERLLLGRQTDENGECREDMVFVNEFAHLQDYAIRLSSLRGRGSSPGL